MPDSPRSAESRPFQPPDLSGSRAGAVRDDTSRDRKEGLGIFRQAGFAPAPPVTTSLEMQLERNDRLPEFSDLTIRGFVYS